MAQGYVRTSDLPSIIPLFPLAGVVLLPRGQLPLNIFEPRYLNMLDDVMGGERLIGMIQPTGGTRETPGLAPVGCAGRVTAFAETGDGRYLITLTGLCRFQLNDEMSLLTPYRQARVDYSAYADDLAPTEAAGLPDRARLLSLLGQYLDTRQLEVDWKAAREAPPEALVNSLSMALPFEPAEKQALLEAPTLAGRAQVLSALMQIDAADTGDERPSLQ